MSETDKAIVLAALVIAICLTVAYWDEILERLHAWRSDRQQ